MNSTESGQSTSPEYLDAFSLYCAPYENSLDPKFFYASTGLMQRLDLLTHLTQFGESVVLVTGPDGSGKTTLLSRFVAQASPSWRLCLFDGREIEQLPRHMARALDAENVAGELELLAGWAARTDASQLLVIVVDNAQLLDQAACSRLCDLLGQPQGERVRILLFGTQEIQGRVEQALEEHACSRTTQMLEIPRLSAEETASYLMYRLAVAGYSGESPFTATEVRAICKAADGRPAEINRLAHRALLERLEQMRSRPLVPETRNRSGQVRLWLSASLGLLVVLAYVGWQRLPSPGDVVEQLPELASISPETEVPLTLPALADGEDSSTGRENAGVALDLAPALAAPGQPVDTRPVVEAVPQPVAPDVRAQPSSAPDLAVNEVSAPPAGAKDENFSLPLPSPAETPTMQAQTVGAVADLATAEPGREVQPLAAAPPSPARPHDTKLQQQNGPHREEWLLKQSPKLYSLQLLGSRSEKSVNRFVREHGLDLSQTAYYQGSFKDSEWYVLMYGLYPSRDAALKARDALPVAVRKGKPWPRSLESVQSAIREMHR